MQIEHDIGVTVAVHVGDHRGLAAVVDIGRIDIVRWWRQQAEFRQVHAVLAA